MIFLRVERMNLKNELMQYYDNIRSSEKLRSITMEYIDIFDENNNPTGKVKEKQQAHEDGNFHRTAHVWIINDKNELLLQKRSASKKTHPNCWDISGAGHIKAGESVVDGAIRELKEELGVEAEEKDLQYIATIKSTKNPKNMEFQYVYLLNCNKEIEEYIFEDNEVSEVKYIFYKDLEKMVEEKIEGLLIHEEEYKYLFTYITNKNIKIRKCNANDVDSIYNIQNIVIDNFKEEEKGYFLPFKKDTYLRIVNDPINDGEIYGAFIDNKMIAWIFLSVSNRMKELKQMIPNIKGNCADIDGVIVLPEYRGYGLQKILVKYLEEKAREKGISNIIAEVTFENVYSLRNLKDLGYEEQTWYQKDENIKRYILLKKLGEVENE